ncbi:MAG: hypothetical protein ISS71_04765 [Phycisphaerae bacterium]|nr:hypothetical protein [Phycisphaerae bacterium]
MKEKSALVRMNEIDCENLDHLVEITKSNRAAVLRSLIPNKEIIDAMIAFTDFGNRFSDNNDPLRYRRIIDDMKYAFVHVFRDIMQNKHDPDQILPQLDIVTSDINLLAATLAAAKLFVKWSSAKRAIDGFYFKKFEVAGQQVNIVLGPDDSPEYIDHIESEVKRYAEKLYG